MKKAFIWCITVLLSWFLLFIFYKIIEVFMEVIG
jgi:hypothetical protein